MRIIIRSKDVNMWLPVPPGSGRCSGPVSAGFGNGRNKESDSVSLSGGDYQRASSGTGKGMPQCF